MKFVLKNAFISIDASDLSDHCAQVEIDTGADEQDATGFGSGYKETLQGLKDATITPMFQQDFAAASVDSVLWPLNVSGETFTVIVKANDVATSATNPSYTMQGQLFGYKPISGKVGDVATTGDVPIRNADPSGIVRAIV